MSAIKQSFIKGTMILLVAGIVNRILGFVPRIWLPRVIGAEGIGLYQMGYPFLIVLLTFITGGIPLGIAKLVAEAESAGDERRVGQILRVSLGLSLTLGFVFMAGCLLLSDWLTQRLFTDSRVQLTFVAMSPILVLVAVSAVLRGYFQGRHNMIPTAASQLVETALRIAGQLVLASLMLPYGLEYAAAGAMLGVVIGEIGGMLALVRSYLRTRGAYAAGSSAADSHAKADADAASVPAGAVNGSVWSRLMGIVAPVTASRLVGSASYFFESILIVQSLAIAGVVTAAATAQYGMLQGMVIPVLLMPTALTYSLAVSLVPSLSEAAARGDMKTIHKRLHQSMRLALVAGAPFAVILFVLAEPLCYFLYGDQEAGRMLRLMAPVALFVYVQGPLQAALQALDRPGTALFNTLIGSIVKLALIYKLASMPQWGIYGAIAAISVNIALVTLMHWGSVARMLKFSLPLSDFLKVGMGMTLMAGAVALVMGEPWIDSPMIRFLAACGAGAVCYIICLFGLKLVDRSDLVRLPWIGPKLARWLP